MTPAALETSAAAAPRSVRAILWRVLWRVAVFVAVLYVGLCLVLYAIQTRMMFPGAASRGTPEAVVAPAADCRLVTLKTARGESVVALYGPALSPAGAPLKEPGAGLTILYFYGNGMCLADAATEFEDFRRMGANVVIPEFVGYGMSTGAPSEQGCYDTADAAWAWLQSQDGLDKKRIVVAGWSLGAAVAIDLASRHPGEVAGVMTFSAFTSAPDVGSRFYPFLPVKSLMKFRFDNAGKIGRIDCPILIGHGRRDNLIPFDMAGTLAKTGRAARRDVTEMAVDNAGHNDFFATGGREVEGGIRAFLRRLESSGPGR